MTSQVTKTLFGKSLALVLYLLLVYIWLGAVSIGCTNRTEVRGSFGMSKIEIAQSDRGQTFKISQGDVILIRLEENPSTGYQWIVNAVDESVLELQASDYSRAPVTKLGAAGGVRTFTFKAISPGIEQLQLKLRRQWEPEDATIEHFEVTLQIEEK